LVEFKKATETARGIAKQEIKKIIIEISAGN